MIIYSPEEAIKYVKDKKYYPPQANLTCFNLQEKEDSEGMINLVYRITNDDDGSSVIFKQSMPRMLAVTRQKGAEYAPEMPMDRLATEIKMLVFLKNIAPEIVPEVYLVDYEKGISLMEDLSHLDIMRFTLRDGHKYPLFGKKLGPILAEMHFLTSAYALCPEDRRKMMDYFKSSAWDRVNDFFAERCPLTTDYIQMDESCTPLRERTRKNPLIQAEREHLSDVFLSRFCLVHNDVHTSNIMIDDREMKLIDSELAGFSAPYVDLGRLSGSFITNYISWQYREELAEDHRKDMQAYDVQMLLDLFNAYRKTLEKLWQHYDIEDEVSVVYHEILKDTLLYATGWTLIKVASDVYMSPDIACVTDPKRLAALQLQACKMAEDVWINIDSVKTIEDFTGIMARYFEL